MKFIIESGMLNERIKQGIKKAVETASKSRLVLDAAYIPICLS